MGDRESWSQESELRVGTGLPEVGEERSMAGSEAVAKLGQVEDKVGCRQDLDRSCGGMEKEQVLARCKHREDECPWACSLSSQGAAAELKNWPANFFNQSCRAIHQAPSSSLGYQEY